MLVTGASGFIGGKVCERLQQLSLPMLCCGRRASEQPGYFRCDLSEDIPALTWNPEVVIHAAARSSPWGSKAQFQRDNVQATQKIVDLCRRIGRPKLVHISSASIYYRNEDQLGITELTPQAERPVNRYAATKQQAESIVRSYEGPWVILRPRAVFGPGDSVLLPRILEAARQGRLPLLIRSGEPVRGDLIYIDNLVDYILKAATLEQIQGEYNVSNNEPIEINAFLLQVFEQLGIHPPKRRISVETAMLGAAALELLHRVFRPRQEPAITRFGVHVLAYSKTFDVSKMIRDLGQPRISLTEGVHRTVEALKSNSNVNDRA